MLFDILCYAVATLSVLYVMAPKAYREERRELELENPLMVLAPLFQVDESSSSVEFNDDDDDDEILSSSFIEVEGNPLITLTSMFESVVDNLPSIKQEVCGESVRVLHAAKKIKKNTNTNRINRIRSTAKGFGSKV